MRVRVALFVAFLLLAGCAGDKSSERWVVQELGTRAEFRDLFFLDEQRGWIVGGGVNIEGGILGTTNDGGRTWSFRSGIARSSGSATSFHLNAVWFVNENTGFIVADGFRILRTRDGGKHWHRARSQTRIWAHMWDLQFVDDTHGWAIGEGGLVRTVDGGETWEGPLALDPDAEDWVPTRGQAIHFVDRDHGWLVGKHGLIRQTDDGGESWYLVGGEQRSEKPDLWSVDFTGMDHGWTVGANGTILHTDDGGESWNRQRSPAMVTLTDIDMLDRSRGWAVGFERRTGTAVVIRTTDGGETWSEQIRVGSEEIRAIFVLNERHAWAVGQQQRRSDDDRSQKLLRYEVDEPE